MKTDSLAASLEVWLPFVWYKISAHYYQETTSRDILLHNSEYRRRQAGGEWPISKELQIFHWNCFSWYDFPCLRCWVLLSDWEILEFVHPMDLYHFIRSTRALRQLLLSTNAIPIWRRSFLEHPDIPFYPEDISAPKWASLLFGPAICDVSLNFKHLLHSSSLSLWSLCRSAVSKIQWSILITVTGNVILAMWVLIWT